MADAQDDSDDDKPYDATQRRLDEARRDGEVPSSADLTTAAAYAGLLLAAGAVGPKALADTTTKLAVLLDQADTLSRALLGGSGLPISAGLFAALAAGMAIWFVLPMAIALVAIVAQRAFVVAPSRIMPRLSRVSPIATAKQKFGRTGMFEFGKSFAKLLVFSAALGFFLWDRLPRIVATAATEPAAVVVETLRLSMGFLAIVVAVSLAIGAVDLVWQHADHARRHRMSRKEMTDEMKETEGDPHLRQARRQRGYDIATNRMLADVPKADVVIVNPHHYAVALRWDRGSGRAPVCVAKGVDEVARRIRETAAAAAIPIHRDPPTARALHAAVSLGEEIRPEHYRPVAAAIRFAEAMRQRARARGR